MATNLAIDDRLIEEARRIGGHGTKKEAVTVALQEYVARRKQLAVLDLFGTIDFDKSYDYRRSRQLDRVGQDR
jgi:Arc/MetJ family transcription regulator